MESRFEKKFSLPPDLSDATAGDNYTPKRGWFFTKATRKDLLAFINNERKLTRQANDKKWRARIEGSIVKLNEGTLERIITELSMLQEGSIFRSDVAYLVKMFNLLNSALDKLLQEKE